MDDRCLLFAQNISYADIVRDVSLQVRSGEIVALIGPNGAGKSTVLKVLSGILRISRGQIEWLGRDPAHYSAKQRARAVAFLPQQSHVDVPYTVQDVVELGYYAHGRAMPSATLHALLREVGLPAFAHRDVRTLSGGERQRVWLAKVLAQDAPLLLLDEPVSGLDPGYQMDILDLARRLAQNGKGVLITLHDMEQVLRYADRVVVLCAGVAIAEGQPLEILTSAAVECAFGVRATSFADPVTGAKRLSLSRLSEGERGMAQSLADISQVQGVIR